MKTFMRCAAAAVMCAAAGAEEGGKSMALTEKERALVRAAGCAARGENGKMGEAWGAALRAGWTVEELKEAGYQTYAYCGFPRALNALGALRAALPEGERGRVGENAVRPDAQSLERGAANQTKLCGGEVKGAFFEWAPAIDDYLKAHLFGDVFGRGGLDWRTREMFTVALLAAMDGVEAQLKAHMGIAKLNGVTDGQLAAILGEVRNESTASAFGAGEANVAYSKYFSGRSFLKRLTVREKELGVPVFNVTFEPGCRNNWHKHTGGQMLIGVGGTGWYQARGEKAVKIEAGTVVEIPPDVEHWHGADPDCWFSHLAVECNPGSNKNTWLEGVTEADYLKATRGEK